MAKERVSNIPAIVGEMLPASVSAIDLTDADAIKREAMESLLLMMARNKGDIRSLGIVREVLDRLEGRPVARNINADAGSSDVAKRLDAAIARRDALRSQ